MNFLRRLFTTLSIFVFIEEIISKDVFLYKDLPSSPLALIKKRNSALWELAIPRRSSHNDNEAGYSYDDIENENGDKDEFKIACSASSDQLKAVEEQWRKSDKSFEESRLFFVHELQEYEELSVVCREPAKPSIKKLEKTDKENNPIYCGKSQAELYEVGYPVSTNRDGEDIQFMSIYKICHSMAADVGTLYTIHHIVSPDLMMLNFREWYEPKLSHAFKSHLDGCLDCLNTFYLENKYHVYQFVGMYDMPTKLWRLATYFPFNFTPVKDKYIFMGLLRADQFIQLFSRKTNQPLTLYSGTYETKVKIVSGIICTTFNCNRNLEIKLFWKIIVDSENHGIILITQLTQQKCDRTRNTLCQDNSTIVMLETYKNGGCTYTCPVTKTIISQLGLPATELNLEIGGVLSLDFKVSPPQLEYLRRIGTGGPSDASTRSVVAYQVGISDFMGNADKFAPAAVAVDAERVPVMENDENGAAEEAGLNDGRGGSSGSEGNVPQSGSAAGEGTV